MLVENISIDVSKNLIQVWDKVFYSKDSLGFYRELEENLRKKVTVKTRKVKIVVQEEVKDFEEIPEEERREGEDIVREVVLKPKVIEEFDEIVSISFLDTQETKDSKRDEEILEAKQLCKSHIYAKYSAETQANMTARIAEINLLCTMEGRKPNEEETKDITEANTMITWIRDRRAKCTEDIEKIITKYS